jgi:hypothetical protein
LVRIFCVGDLEDFPGAGNGGDGGGVYGGAAGMIAVHPVNAGFLQKTTRIELARRLR